MYPAISGNGSLPLLSKVPSKPLKLVVRPAGCKLHSKHGMYFLCIHCSFFSKERAGRHWLQKTVATDSGMYGLHRE